MPEKFLILGSSSFYGSNFAKLVREKGDEAICLSKPGWYLGDELPDGEYVVNFASQSLVAESWENPGLWITTNVQSTTALFRGVLFRRFKKFIHVSTPESYGHTDGWVTENYKSWVPSTPYGVSRAAADLMLMAYHRAYQFPALITRTANIYGEGQPDHRIIPKAFKFKKEGKKLPLHGNGDSVRCFIHVRDACEATYLLAKEGKVGETYHISTRQSHWIRDVVEMIGCEWKAAPERLGKDGAYLLHSGKVRDLGWEDTIKLEDWIASR
ncbi:MAG TPA: GDP-mannose 4,6-dehydratase [Candidatus Binatia bacterium]|nr:GDP-mannose 4,6-dehydratase [Candidatus Binatia bacterium]